MDESINQSINQSDQRGRCFVRCVCCSCVGVGVGRVIITVPFSRAIIITSVF